MDENMSLEQLKDEHETLVSTILQEEESLLSHHRKHIDNNVDLVKRQMSILNDVDKPGSDVECYIKDLDQILTQNMEMIKLMKSKLGNFRGYLAKEAKLSKLFYQEQEKTGNEEDEMLDCYDLCHDEMMVDNVN